MNQSSTILEFIILFILILLSSYFSGAETALSTVNRVKLRTLAAEGDKRAALVLKVLSQYSKMLSAILICNNVVNLSASALSTSLIIRIFGENFVSLATAALTVLIILFGEITPKNAAKIKALETSKRNAPVINFLMVVLTPLIVIIDFLAGIIMKVLHIDANAKQLLTENELKTYVEVGREDGAIENREKKIIYNVFDFGDSEAKDIMIPRIDMVCVSIDATYEEIMDLFKKEMYTRLPVYDTDPDHIIGHLNIKDLILVRNPAQFKVKRLMHESYFTYEYKKTADLLKQMQKKSYGIAFVLDEYGSTVGMITLEDLIEEIVGDIRDEYDDDEKQQLRRYDDLTYLVDGAMKLIDINEQLGCDLYSEDFDSIGGLMIGELDRLPVGGETVELSDGTTLKAMGIRRNRIVKVLLRFKEKPGQRDAQIEAQEAAEKVAAQEAEGNSVDPTLMAAAAPVLNELQDDKEE